MHARTPLVVVVVGAVLATGCRDGGPRDQNLTPFSPSAAGPVTPVSAGSTAATPPAGSSAAQGGRTLVLPPEVFGATSVVVAFPPRDESYAFRTTLEATYRDGLRRAPISTYVDVEGDVVWMQEYLRYRVNGCDHATSVQRVFDQIDGRGIGPVCAEARGGAVPFPPRDESYGFRQELEMKYRDGLRRPLSSTHVDVEGSAVWVQEYLRYRVNACDHASSEARVLDQIAGRGIAPHCLVTEPEGRRTLTGIWHGTSTYWNAPFEMTLQQRGNSVTGSYRDQKDAGSVSDYPGPDEVTLLVYFGDAGLLFRGRFVDEDHVEGTIAYQSHRWPFTMVR